MEENYILIIEWDGKKPPSRWYGRLAKLGLTAAGDYSKREEGVIARRASEAGVTHQEGAIICVRESTARSLGHIATELGAKAVTVARLEVCEMSMTQADQAALERITRTLSKRGRPAKDEPSDWVVTCRDEAVTYQLTEHREPSYCPHCASFNVSIRNGLKNAVSYNRSLDVIGNWVATRFLGGGFEIPLIDPNAPPANGEVWDAEENRLIKVLGKSTLAQEIAAFGSFEIAMHLLDLGFINLQLAQSERLTRRIHSITDFIGKGGDPLKYTLVCQPDDVSLIDLFDQDRKLIFGIIAFQETAHV